MTRWANQAGLSAVIRSDAHHLPLPTASVDLIVTSPPYFGLRSYTDNGKHYSGQIGSEATPAEFIAALLACTREWMRVLKPTGSLFINLGDKYSSGGHGPSKSLLGLPWRYAIAVTDQLGLILRRDIIWNKPNGLPESVTDRCRSSHEYVFHLVKQPRYYAAVDEIREAHEHHRRDTWDRRPPAVNGLRLTGNVDARVGNNPLGKLPGSVWTIPTQPLNVPAHLGVEHFAAFPMELPRKIILGWSPPGVCTACGEGRRPVVVRDPQPPEPARRQATRLAPGQPGNGTIGFRNSKLSGQEWNAFRAANPDTITGYACDCPSTDAPTRPAVILDPFGGTGTTALVASMYGRIGLSFDLSHDYCRLATWRTQDPAQRAAALGVPKPPPTPSDTDPMF